MTSTPIRKQLALCSTIAIVNALCWALLTPTFWAPDEPYHMGYVQYLAETGEMPQPAAVNPKDPQGPSGEQGLTFDLLPFGVQGKPSTSPSQSVELLHRLKSGDESRASPGQAFNATSNPPLYYGIQAGAYRAAYAGTYLDRLLVARVVSALFAGLTVCFAFLFLRQLLPTRPWTWSVGALALAFQPVFGFMSGAVTNDAMVYAASAAVLWGVARAFRQGLNLNTGLHIGVAMAVGLLTKLTLVGLLPGLLVALVCLVIRGWGHERRSTILGAVTMVLAVALPYQGYILLRRAASPSNAALDSGIVSGTSGAGALREQLSYVWQSVLPRLPFMEDQVTVWKPWEVYFKGFIGRFGWAEYQFPSVWYFIALGIFAGIAGLALKAIYDHRAVCRARGGEILAYLALGGGTFLAVEVAAARYFSTLGLPFEQARYLFPVLLLYPALLALAAIGAGPRWGRAVGALLVTLAIGQSLFAQLLTLGRFYS